VEADAVVLASGSSAVAPLVEPIDTELASTLREIPTAPMLVIALGYETATLGHPLDGFGFLVPRGERLRLLGALWDSSIYPGRAPAGRAIVRVMLGGAHDPAAMQLDDGEAVRMSLDGLRVAMGITSEPVFTRVFRHPLGIPQYTVGHLDRLARIERRLEQHPGLFVAGNSYRGVAMNSCIAEAAPLAARIVEGRR
jgi:oxygen-dependent protoporphyrinogen oxidase